jgi:hypothetical protein
VGDAVGASQIITALFGLGGVVVGSLISGGMQASLLGRRIEADHKLAERRFAQEREQIIYKRRFELAETLLADAYRFRGIIETARNGGSFGEEGKSRKPAEREAEDVSETKNMFFIPVERLQKNGDFLGEFFAKQFAATAQFGSKARESFDIFGKAISDIYIASGMLITMVDHPSLNDQKVKDELLDVLWAHRAQVFKREEKIENLVEKAIANLEAVCRPILEQTSA